MVTMVVKEEQLKMHLNMSKKKEASAVNQNTPTLDMLVCFA